MFDQIMDIVYTATIREEEGGTYGVGTQSVLSKETDTWMFLFRVRHKSRNAEKTPETSYF